MLQPLDAVAVVQLQPRDVVAAPLCGEYSAVRFDADRSSRKLLASQDSARDHREYLAARFGGPAGRTEDAELRARYGGVASRECEANHWRPLPR